MSPQYRSQALTLEDERIDLHDRSPSFPEIVAKSSPYGTGASHSREQKVLVIEGHLEVSF